MKPPTRPVFLDLARLRLPLPGWVSILHRVSGVLLFLAVPLGVAALSVTLASEAGFQAVSGWMTQAWAKLLLLAWVWAFLHHLLAGLRHLAMDAHCGVQLRQARTTGAVVLAGSAVATLAVAGWLFA